MLLSMLALLLTAEPKMHISVTRLTATEQKAAVSKVMAEQLEPLKGCYDLALKDAPELKGLLSLRITLEAKQTTAEQILVDEGSTLKDDTVSACVKARLSSTEWPKAGKRSEIAVTLKFAVSR